MSLSRLMRSVVLGLAIATLAATAASADQAERALHLRSQALNQHSVTASADGQAARALHLRSQALNDRYATAASPPADGGIDLSDAGIVVLALSVLSLSAYAARRRRADPVRGRTAAGG